jgi:drug/metabolite transporter (DMT)-like permease
LAQARMVCISSKRGEFLSQVFYFREAAGGNSAGTTWPVLGLIVAMMLWGSSFIAMKMAVAVHDPVWVIFGRMLVASAIFASFGRRFKNIRVLRKDWIWIGFMALCEPCLYFLFETHALKWTSASEAAMITALLPLMTVAAARLVLKEEISIRTVIGISAAMVGVVILTALGRTTESSPNPLLGNTLEFLAMVCATGYTLAVRHLSARYSPFFLTAIQAFVGSLFFLPALFLPGTEWPVDFVWWDWAPILYLGSLVNVLAYFLYNFGLSRIPASQVSPYVNLIPVFSMLLGWMLLGEQLRFSQYLAAGLVFGGAFAGYGRRA